MFALDPSVVFLNHGSFGSCPTVIRGKQTEYQAWIAGEPVSFILRDLEPLYRRSVEKLASFIGTVYNDLVLLPNVTTAVNTVLKSLLFRPRDEVLITNHIYGACRVALDFVAQKTGLRIREVNIPFPLCNPGIITEKVLAGLTPDTKLVFIDHISSPTGLLFPVRDILNELNRRGIDSLIDGAHAPGATPLDIGNLNPTYYAGNCHKWMCAPMGVGFLWVREDRQSEIQPLVHSHFSGPGRPFHERFFWAGTTDLSPALCLADVIDYFAVQYPGGWQGMMQHNHDLICEARKLLCQGLGIPLPCPDNMITTLAAIPLGASGCGFFPGLNEIDLLQEELFRSHRIEVPVYSWNGTRIIRPSAQLYNHPDQYRDLLTALSHCENV